MRFDYFLTRVFAPLTLLVLLLSACSDDPEPALEVQVVTGLVAGPEFGSVLTEVFPGAGTMSGTVVPLRVQASFGEPFATGKSVATFPNLAHGDYTVWVHLYRPNGTILIERRVQINYAGAYVLRVHLTRDCLPANITCPDSGGSPEYTECLAGRCVDPRCNPADPATREFCPEVVFCNGDSECTDAVAPCAENKCVTGVCTPTESPGSLCPPSSWCDPDSSGIGCTPLDAGDAGPADAGMTSDAGNDDMGNPLCGTPCAVATLCHSGAWNCTGGVAVCEDLGPAPRGTPCGSGLECNLSHLCASPCVADQPCIIEGSCSRAIFDCETETCNPTTPPETLAAGDACGAGRVCNPSGACIECDSSAWCSSGDCERGQVHCETGVPTCGECTAVVCRSQVEAGTPCRLDHESCAGTTCDDGAICSDVEGLTRFGEPFRTCAMPGDACVSNCLNGTIQSDGTCTGTPGDFAAAGTRCSGDVSMICNDTGDCVSEF